MELLYIYIKEYEGLVDSEFNFSPEYNIHFNRKTIILEVNKDNDWLDNFWGSNSIHSITGIVGKNGSGKTTLLRLLLRIGVDGAIYTEPENIIIAYKRQSNSKKISLYIGKNLELKNKKDFEILNSTKHNKISYIYHSNHFDPYNHPLDLTKNELVGMSNIGTNYLLLKDKETYLNRSSDSRKFTFSKTVLLHKAMELRRHVNFIRKYKNDKDVSFFKVPRYLVLKPDTEEEEWLRIHDDEQKREYSRKISEHLSFVFNTDSSNRTQNEIIRFLFIKSSIFNLINHSYSLSTSMVEIPEFLKQIKYLVLVMHELGDTESFYEKLLLKFPDLPFVIKNQIDLKNLFKLIAKHEIIPKRNVIIIDLKQNEITVFNKFLNTHFTDDRSTSFIDIELSHNKLQQTTPSSGELAMINFFARLCSIKKTPLKNRLIFLLDEVELALHPEWQRKYINSVIHFLQKEFVNKKIQIIITSHSPFVVSDLPKNCLNLLNGNMENNENTFGANIHSLYADSFFMKDGFIGEFAMNKIQNILDDLNTIGPFQKQRIREIGITIKLIGETFIKKELLSMYNLRYNRENRLKELKKEMEELGGAI